MTVPSQLRDTDKTRLAWDQLRNALSHPGLRDRILLELDMTNALRPGELFAVRWKCFDQAESKMYVFVTAYKWAIRPWAECRSELRTSQLDTMHLYPRCSFQARLPPGGVLRRCKEHIAVTRWVGCQARNVFPEFLVAAGVCCREHFGGH